KDTFDKVQELLSARGQRLRSRRGDPTHGLLSGLLTCTNCGSRIYHKAHAVVRSTGKTYRSQFYVCNGRRRKRPGQANCYAKMIRVDHLDRDVWEMIESYLADPAALVRKVVQQDKRIGGHVSDLEAKENRLVKELEELEAEAAAVWAEQKANNWPLAFVTPK